MPEPEKLKVKATWWEEREDDPNPPSEEVELELFFESGTFFIDGLREGHYLDLDLSELARAIAAEGMPACKSS